MRALDEELPDLIISRTNLKAQITFGGNYIVVESTMSLCAAPISFEAPCVLAYVGPLGAWMLREVPVLCRGERA